MSFARLLVSLLLLLPLAATAQTPAPRPGVDFVELTTPQPTWAQGKIEVVEVFGYSCGGCAAFQPKVNVWKPRLGSDVRFAYVPGVFGGIWDNFARAYFAAEAMGVLDKTHDAMFKAIHLDHRIRSGSLEEIADLYASFGIDRATFLSTMNSFAVNAKMNRAKQFALRTGVNATPTIIVAGKYRVMTTQDRGHDGMLATVDWLLARERAAAKAASNAPAKPAGNG